MSESIFRKESLDHVSSPDQMNYYLRVSNPAVWLVVLAVLVFMIAGILWASTVVISSIMPLNVVGGKDGQYVGYVSYEYAGNAEVGMPVRIGEKEGKIKSVSKVPASREEVRTALGSDFVAYALRLAEWNVRVEIEGFDAVAGDIEEVLITTSSTKPMEFLFN